MIRIRVKFFGPFRDLFGGREREVDLPSDIRLKDLLRRLADSPELEKQVFADSGEVHSHVVIMKNGTPVRVQEGMESLLQDGETIALFPFMGGG
jgi:molybdopterin synthase sulfur carrier subunit